MSAAAPPSSRRRRPVAKPAASGVRRTRERKEGIRLSTESKQKIAKRVIDFAKRDRQNREPERDLRLQRYAKLRMWTEEQGDFPWPDSANFAVPDVATDSLRTQDTLHNAFMTHRPAIISKSTRRNDQPKEKTIDELIDHQVFVEQDGEGVLEETAECFVNDGVYTIFAQWVREKRPVRSARFFPKIPIEAMPDQYFSMLLDQEFKQHQHVRRDPEGWDWRLSKGSEEIDVSFYTEPKTGKVRMVIDQMATQFDGAKLTVKDYDDVLYPIRSANLQPPGPSNPNGAPHVILVDRITLDQLKRGQKDGLYPLVSKKALDDLDNVKQKKDDDDASQQQKDDLAGQTHEPLDKPETAGHKPFTLYTCFDRYDIDDDGLEEDIVWWVVLEHKLLIRAAHLTEEWPLRPTQRPLAESTFLPIKGRREGISLPELMESTHDLMKELWDQMVDSGTLTNSPFGFYRPQSSIKPEVVTLFPGELYPLQDPARDVNFPTFGNPGQAFWINTIGIVGQLQEKLTVIGDLKFGRIPTGKSSALRTSGGINAVLEQGEARPERLLRRFFKGWVDAWRMIHQLNQHYLEPGKQFRIVGWKPPGGDPYREVSKRSEIEGDYEFDFKANVANASKSAMGQALQQAMAMLVSPIAIQMGISTPETIYRLLFDALNILGVESDLYTNPPDPEAQGPVILAEEALSEILQQRQPVGNPLEPGGWNEHLSKLIDFTKDEQIRLALVGQPEAQQILDIYMKKVADKAKAERERAQLAEAAGQQSGPAGTPGPDGQGSVDLNAPPVNENELLDETLTGAGGGAAQ